MKTSIILPTYNEKDNIVELIQAIFATRESQKLDYDIVVVDYNSPDVSADAIMTHVVLGTKILRQGGIPEPVVEFAYTHHGTQVVEFFWHKCMEQGNPKGLTQEHFRYPGILTAQLWLALPLLALTVFAAVWSVSPGDPLGVGALGQVRMLVIGAGLRQVADHLLHDPRVRARGLHAVLRLADLRGGDHLERARPVAGGLHALDRGVD